MPDKRVRHISRVQFGLLNPAELLDYAVAEITEHDYLDSNHNPIMGGVLDPRMGAMDRNKRCKTCHLGIDDCPGHFGYIDLARPLYIEGFEENALTVFKCVCTCGVVQVSPKDPNYKKLREPFNKPGAWSPEARLRYVLEAAEKFSHCGVTDNVKRAASHNKLNHQRQQKQQTPQTPQTPQEGDSSLMDAPEVSSVSQPGKDVYCFGCNKHLRKYQIKDRRIIYSSYKGTGRLLRAHKAYKILSNILPEDKAMLGFQTHEDPTFLLFTVLPVGPLCIRLSNFSNPAVRGENELTLKYVEIVRANKNLRRVLLAKEHPDLYKVKKNENADEIHDLLQDHVNALMNAKSVSQVVTSQRNSTKVQEGIRQRHDGKSKRVRGNLNGNRADCTARTVIIPDPYLDIDEVGVPLPIAMTILFPERVTNYNIHVLAEAVRIGPYKRNGARFVDDKELGTFDLRLMNNTAQITLKPGMVVRRMLRDGDVTFLNRQPSLHKVSTMVFRIRIYEYIHAFGLNIFNCNPFHADFDGDEMNLKVPQTAEAVAELKELASLPRCILHSQNNKNVCGLQLDEVMGGHFITHKDTFLTRDDFAQLCIEATISPLSRHNNSGLPMPTILKAVNDQGENSGPLWTGKQLYQQIFETSFHHRQCARWHKDVAELHSKRKDLPEHERLTLKREMKFFPLMDEYLRIDNGEILMGALCKNSLSTVSCSIIHMLCLNKLQTPDDMVEIVRKMQRLALSFIARRGFTIHMDNLRPVQKENQTLHTVVREIVLRMDAMGLQGKEREEMQLKAFEQLKSYVLQMAKSRMDHNDAFYQTIQVGTKGEWTALLNLMGALCQQNADGGLILRGFGDRSFAHELKGVMPVIGSGMIFSNLVNGITPPEYVVYCIGARIGLIDTAVKTPETGYVQRKIGKGLEGNVVCHDGTIRDANSSIIEFNYGDDDYDPSKIIVQTPKLTRISKEETLVQKYSIGDWNQDEVQILKGLWQQNRKEPRRLPVPIPLPLHQMVRCFKPTTKDWVLTAEFVETWHQRKLELFRVLEKYHYSRRTLDGSAFEMHFHEGLSLRRLLIKHHYNEECLERLFEAIERQYRQCIVAPGDCVGIVASQSIGEPTTQMTLNTTHHVGDSAHNVTLGIPRAKEIVNMSKKIRTPALTIYLGFKEHHESSYAWFSSLLPKLAVKDLVTQSKIEKYEVLKPNAMHQLFVKSGSSFNSTLFQKQSKQQKQSTTASATRSSTATKRPRKTTDVTDSAGKKKGRKPSVKLTNASQPFLSSLMSDEDSESTSVSGFNSSLLNSSDSSELQSILSASTSMFGAKKTKVQLLQSWGEESIVLHFSRAKLSKHHLTDRDIYKALDCKLKFKSITWSNFEDTQNIVFRIRLQNTDSPHHNRSVLAEVLDDLLEAYVGGVDGIQSAQATDLGSKRIIFSRGSNLKHVFALPYVDYVQTTTNDIYETFLALGIGATAQNTMQELRQLLSFGGTEIDQRHINLFVMNQVYRGVPTPFTRHGIKKSNKGVLAKSSFEETTEVFLNAARYHESDPVQDPTASIMTGKPPAIGTHFSHILTDKQKESALLLELPEQPQYTEKTISGIDTSKVVDHSIFDECIDSMNIDE